MEPNSPFPIIEMKPKNTPWRFIIVILGVASIVGGSFLFIGNSPKDFTPGTIVSISSGSSIRDVGDKLEKKMVIRSSTLFQFVVKMGFSDKPVLAGDFEFIKPLNVVKVAQKIVGGKFGSTQTKVTLPEGVSVNEIAQIMAKNVPSFETDEFVAKAKKDEGYLFPETYIVFKTITTDQFITQLKKEYSQKIKTVSDLIKKSGHTESQIITMASLLEKEAKNEKEAKIISGILWKRIEKGMPLQVDAPFLYTLGKTSAQLTKSDLEKDGVYNTYTRKGLPKGPIGNPGLAMIRSAASPEPSVYFFYLHDKKGIVHYAVTYEDHLINKNKYLK